MIKDAYWDYDTMEVVLIFNNEQELRISIYTLVKSHAPYLPLDWLCQQKNKDQN